MNYPTIEDAVGRTPLVRLQRVDAEQNAARGNVVLAKLEGNNPAGSVKDRPALSMIRRAEERGEIKPGDTLIEATSGNTGIALAMAAAQLPGLGALGYAAPVWLLGLLVAGLLSRDGLAAALTGARYADSRTAPVLADRPEHHSESRDGAARPH